MTLSEPEIGALVATLARAGGLAGTAPVIGDNGVPIRARLFFVVAIVAVVGPNRPGVALDNVAIVAVVELAVGLLTGLCARFVMSRAAIAGQLFGLTLGLGFAAQYDIHAGESAGTLRSMVSAIAGLVFLASGGLEAIVQGATAAPAHVIHLGLLGPALLEHGASAMTHGLALAAPIVLATLIGNVGLALISRAAPAANIFAISLAAIIVLGGLMLVATAAELVGGIGNDAQHAISILRGGGT